VKNQQLALSRVCPRGTTELPMHGLSGNLTFVGFSKICQENSSFIKI